MNTEQGQQKQDTTPVYTAEDFKSEAIYKRLYEIQNPFEQAMEKDRLTTLAVTLKVKNFISNYKAYVKMRKQIEKKEPPEDSDVSFSEFENQPYQIMTGVWTANDETGVWRLGPNNQRDYACSHMIMPIELIYGVDTGRYRVKLRFRRGGRKRAEDIIVDIDKLSSSRAIVDALTPFGVSVTSGARANAMVDYIRDILDMNSGVIPIKESVSRLGWNKDGFFPYTGEAVFDAEPFRAIYNCIRQVGDYKEWLKEALDARTYSIAARIVLAASFASVLVEPLGISPFFVHLWTVESETGKTVSLMLGLSVWGDPTLNGPLFPSFKSTSVGFEVMAGFLHSLPVFIDELQLAKDSRGNLKFNVYELASGGGKLRSNKSLGLDNMRTWANVFITSGESRIVRETDGEGALNRVIDVECHANDKAIKDGHRTANALKKNYGFAGKDFILHLTQDGQLDRARELYEKFYSACQGNDSTDKQSMAAAAILTADALATEWIFQDGNALTVKEIAEFMKSKESVSLMERGYEMLCGWVAVNAARFQEPLEGDTLDRFGVFKNLDDKERAIAAIIRHPVFDKVCAEYSLDQEGILSHLKSKGLIITGKKGYDKTTRVNGIPQHCIWLKLPVEDEDWSKSNLPPFPYEEMEIL